MKLSRWLGWGCVLIIALILALLSSPPDASAGSTPVYDYIFLIDTSGSMVGQGDGNPAVILPQVKKAIAESVNSLGDGANAVFLPFHQGVQTARAKSFVLNGAADREAAVSYVNALVADGSMTWIWDSLNTALKRVAELRKDGRQHVQTILLFTDGLDNSPLGVTLPDIVKQFGLLRSEGQNLWLKYVTLGVALPTDQANGISSTPGMEVIQNPKGQLKPFYTVEVRPLSLDFGNLAESDSATVDLKLNFPGQAAGLSYRVTGDVEQLSKQGVETVFKVGPAGLTEVQTVTLTLLNKQLMPNLDAEYKGTLTLKSDDGLIFSPQDLPFTFRVKHIPVLSVMPALQSDQSLDFGELKLENGAFGPLHRRWNTQVSPAGGAETLILRAQPASGNPGEMQVESVKLATSSGHEGGQVELTSEDDWFELSLTPGASLTPGKYTGTARRGRLRRCGRSGP